MTISIIYVNGRFQDEKDAALLVSDRGFLFGEGVFTTVRVNNGKCEFLGEHIARLKKHAQRLHLTVPLIEEKTISELIAFNNAFKGVWRLKIILSGSATEKTLIMKLEIYEPSFKIPSRLIVYPQPVENPFGDVKSLSYLTHMQAYRYAQDKNFDDAIFLSSQGVVLETTRANLFWMDESGLEYPSFDLPIIKGVFLSSLIKSLPLPLIPVKKHLDEISSAASVYYCNSLMNICPVAAIGEREFARDDARDVLLRSCFYKK